jgi:hypothetical protein
VLVQLRDEFVADAEGFNVHRRQYERYPEMARVSKVRRSPQAVACGKRNVGELGKPQEVPAVGTARDGYTAIEARKGKPGHGVRLESKPRGDGKVMVYRY